MKSNEQYGDSHYLDLGAHQPLAITRQLYGLDGAEAAVMNLVLKYLLRLKRDRMLDLLKAIDCLERLVEIEQERQEQQEQARKRAGLDEHPFPPEYGDHG